MTTMKLGAVILSAGFSSRMGAFKPLLTIGPKSMIGHCLTLFHDTSIKETVVVAGYRAEEIVNEVRKYGGRYVINHRFENGMLSSIQLGILSLPADCSGFFILPVDIPLVSGDTVKKLIAAFDYSSSYPVYYPLYKDKKGHPPLIHARLTEPILTYSGINGLRGLLRTYEQQCILVQVNDPCIHRDADIPDDYRLLQQLYRKKEATSPDSR